MSWLGQYLVHVGLQPESRWAATIIVGIEMCDTCYYIWNFYAEHRRMPWNIIFNRSSLFPIVFIPINVVNLAVAPIIATDVTLAAIVGGTVTHHLHTGGCWYSFITGACCATLAMELRVCPSLTVSIVSVATAIMCQKMLIIN